MQRQNRRVVVASEHPEVRGLLQRLVTREGEAIIVGQAQNTTEAITLAREMRPDVALIDYQLPHVIGLTDSILSRIGGFDTAQSISTEMPNTRIILLSNLEKYLRPEYRSTSGDSVFLSQESGGTTIPFSLREMYRNLEPSATFVFADVEIKPAVSVSSKTRQRRYKTVLLTALGTGGALFFILALTFGGGIILALAGLAAVLVLKLRKSMLSLLSAGRRPGLRGKEVGSH